MDGSLFVVEHVYDSILEEIKILSDELTRRVGALYQHVPQKHHGRRYKTAIIPYVRRINQLEELYDPHIKKIASRISEISGEGWQENKDIVNLWHQVAHVIEKFSEHPTKKVAALIISKEGVLQSYSANRVPPGINQRAKHYVEGIRKSFIMCAERLALAKFYKLSPREYGDISHQRRVALLSDAITEVGKHSQELRDSYMLATVVPCCECKTAIIASRPTGVIVNTNNGKHFKRSNDFGDTVSAFVESGITLYKLTA